MTTPARTKPGPLGIDQAFLAGASVEFRDFVLPPNRRPGNVTIHIRATQPGNVSIFRLDTLNRASLHVPVQGILAAANLTTTDEDTFTFAYPMGGRGVRVIYANTNATPGTVSCEVTAGEVAG